MTATIENAMAEVQALLDAAKDNKVVDPLGVDGALVKRGDVLTEEQVKLLGKQTPYERHGRGACNQQCAGVPGVGYGYCQRRDHGPELPHLVLSSDYDRTVAWVWQNGEVPIETPDELDDPADLRVETYTIGLRVNYRNKRDLLYVLSVPRKKDDTVEVVDLTHQRMRKIKKALLIPRRDDDVEPTQDQMRWMGEFIAARRKSALDIALRELENRRWDRGTMNASLKKIDIAPRATAHGTSFSMTVDIKLPPGMKEVNVDEATAALRKLMTEGIEALGKGYEVRRIRDLYGGTVEELR